MKQIPKKKQGEIGQKEPKTMKILIEKVVNRKIAAG